MALTVIITRLCDTDSDARSEMILARLLLAVSLLTIFSGAIIMFLGVLPTDRCLVRVCKTCFLVLDAVFLLGLWRLIAREVSKSRDCHGMDAECWVIVNNMATSSVLAFTFLMVTVQDCHGLLRLYTRDLLDHTWLQISRLLRAIAIVMILGMLSEICMMLKLKGFDDLELILANQVMFPTFGTGCGVMGWITGRSSFRLRAQAWLAARGEAVQTAAAIAALIGNQDAEKALQTASSKFRYIRCDRLTEEALKESKPDPKLYTLSHEAELGAVDAFISHSWSDSASAKWAAIQKWRRKFKVKHGREPTLWLDKFCIDQTDIDANLLCLPIFLGGTKKLVIFTGETYLSRLWCVMELFIFMEMGGQADQLEIWLLDAEAPVYSNQKSSTDTSTTSSAGCTGSTSDATAIERQVSPESTPNSGASSTTSTGSIERLRGIYANSNANEAACFLQADKDRLLAIVDAGCGGLDYFNEKVRSVLLKASKGSGVNASTAAMEEEAALEL